LRILRSLRNRYGRLRRCGTGRDHQRPEKRQRDSGVDSAATATGRVTSIAAAIAAASSAVGSGVIRTLLTTEYFRAYGAVIPHALNATSQDPQSLCDGCQRDR